MTKSKMNKNLINQYKINFINNLDEVSVYKKKVDKIPGTNLLFLNQFLDEWGAEGITNELLPAIDNVLNNVYPQYETACQIFDVVITPINTIFYLDDVVDMNYPEIPTEDFVAILEGWRDFLLSPPLNGTVIKRSFLMRIFSFFKQDK